MSPLRPAGFAGGPLSSRPEPPAEPAFDALVGRLADPDPAVRRQAAHALGDRPEAVPVLLARVALDADPAVRHALCTQLARHDVPEVVDGLLGHLASDDAGLRNAVAEVLAKTPRATHARLPLLLHDADPDVRLLAVMVLAELRLDDAEGWLVELVQVDEHPNVVAAAIGELTLHTAPMPRHAGLLRAAAARFPDDPFIGFCVTRALDPVSGAGT